MVSSHVFPMVRFGIICAGTYVLEVSVLGCFNSFSHLGCYDTPEKGEDWDGVFAEDSWRENLVVLPLISFDN
jgi:hypothetical protein